MDRVSRPLLGVLVATVAVFALWIVALKPSSSDSGNSAPSGVGRYNQAISAAHGAVATSNAASLAHGGTLPQTGTSAGGQRLNPASRGASGATLPGAANATRPGLAGAGSAAASAVGAGGRPPSLTLATPGGREAAVVAALAAHKVVAILFYNPGGADDRAVHAELAGVPAHGGHVMKLAVPVSELTRYPVVTAQVPVTMSPTLVLIDRRQQASILAGYVDRFEIAQRVEDALMA